MSNNNYYGQPDQTQGYQDESQYDYGTEPYQQDAYQQETYDQDPYQQDVYHQDGYQQQDQDQYYDDGYQQPDDSQPNQYTPQASSGMKSIGQAWANWSSRAAPQQFASGNDEYGHPQQDWSTQGPAMQTRQASQASKSGSGNGGEYGGSEDVVMSTKPRFIQKIRSGDAGQELEEEVFGGEELHPDEYFELEHHSDGLCSSEELSDEEPVPPNWDEYENEAKATELAQQYGAGVQINAKSSKIVAAHVPNNDELTQCIFDLVPDEIVKKNMQPPAIRQRLGNQKYVDQDFTVNSNQRDSEKYRSLDSKIIQWNMYRWKSLQEIEQTTRQKFLIYDDNIQPNDIIQGELGSCFFLSAISALAERPALVRRLFEGPQLHPSGCQGIWLNIVGVWKQIAVDEFFPTGKTGSFAFASGRDCKLWVPLIEKAYAKAFGSFQAIEGGCPEHSLRDLTGSPYEVLGPELKGDPYKIWDKVLDADKKNYLMVCAKDNNGQGQAIEGRPEMKHPNGLVSGHAYSLIAAHEVTASDNRQYKIVQVRNPWGNEIEWTGRFNDKDRLWTPELKAHLKQEDRADGTFWITIEEFCREFDRIGICKVHPNFVYNFIQKKVTLDHRTKTFPVLIHTQKEGTYYFSIDKENPKIHLEDREPFARITILKLDSDGIKWVGSTASFERNVNVKCKIHPGTYLALVDISPQIFPTNSPNRSFTFSSYGEHIASLQEVKLTKKQMAHLEVMLFNNWGVKDVKAAWKRNQNPMNIGNVVLYTDVLDDKSAGVTMNRAIPSNPNAGLNIILEVQVQNQAACDGSRDAESFQVTVGNTGIYYNKVNDQSIIVNARFQTGRVEASDTSYLSIVNQLLTGYKPFYPVNTKTGAFAEKPAPAPQQPAPAPAQPANNYPTGQFMKNLGEYAESGGYNNYNKQLTQPAKPANPAQPQPAPSANPLGQENHDGWGQQIPAGNRWENPSQDHDNNQWSIVDQYDPYSGNGGQGHGGPGHNFHFQGNGGHFPGGHNQGGQDQDLWDGFPEEDFRNNGPHGQFHGWDQQPAPINWPSPGHNGRPGFGGFPGQPW